MTYCSQSWMYSFSTFCSSVVSWKNTCALSYHLFSRRLITECCLNSIVRFSKEGQKIISKIMSSSTVHFQGLLNGCNCRVIWQTSPMTLKIKKKQRKKRKISNRLDRFLSKSQQLSQKIFYQGRQLVKYLCKNMQHLLTICRSLR